MAITLEAIRAAGGIVHSDGNIFFRDISMLQGLAGAAPAAVAPQGDHDALRCAVGNCTFNGEVARHSMTCPNRPAAVEGPAHWESDDASRPRSRADLARVLDEWNDTTGCIPRMSSWRVEVLSIIEDAFDLGVFLGEKARLAPALEAPAAPAWLDGWKLVPEVATREMCAAMLSFLKDGFSLTENGSRPMSALYADLLAAAPQAPAASSAIATQVIENLLQMARIVNTAVEDWGETKEDDTLHVIFHKEKADKLEEILDFLDSLPDAPSEEGVILSGPSRAARVLRAQAAAKGDA